MSRKDGRRAFLRGAGGACLALPLFPSLFSSDKAFAQAAAQDKCFIHFRTPHGGISTVNMWPSEATLTEQLSYSHEVRRGALSAAVSNGQAAISPVLSADSTLLTPSLVAKMNVLRGLDIPTDMAHNFGGSLGYFDADKSAPTEPMATIDQIMAYSPALYPSLDYVRSRSVIVARTNSGSHGFRTPGDPSSGVSGSAIGGTESSGDLFETLLGGFSAPDPEPQAPARPPVIDSVLESYKRLRDGNRRLSRADRLRLDQHIDKVAELQRRLQTGISAECRIPDQSIQDNLGLRPMDGSPEKNVQFFSLINDVLAVALNCGATRVVSLTVDENNQALTFTSRASQGEDWHNNVAHLASTDAAAQELIRQFNQVFFSGVFLDLALKLDALGDGVGGTLLDHSLLVWGQECGHVTHLPFSMPVVTVGSAGGALTTGSYCDYRNLGRQLSGDSSTGMETSQLWSGLLYNQWLSTALLAMGIPASEWGESSHPGYGARPTFKLDYWFTNKGFSQADAYDAAWQKTGEMLPFLG